MEEQDTAVFAQGDAGMGAEVAQGSNHQEPKELSEG
jgi:hypothetical protein